MKTITKMIVIIGSVIIMSFPAAAQVGINSDNSSPEASAMLDVKSTEKGFLLPRMTAQERDDIQNPATGLMIYCITSNMVNVYNGTDWYELNLSVAPDPFTCGTSTVTFMYNGNSVTYGTVISTNNTCWLDRNLGAAQVATSSTDAAAYGDLFQWGRLDDGHQVKTSSTTSTLSNVDVPGHGNFILAPNSPYDWRSPQNPNLWQGVNGINNPCPDGYRLPTFDEWNTERLSWSSNNAEGAFASPLKLPLPGTRDNNDGTVVNVGWDGIYWCNSVTGLYSWRLYFNITNAGMYDNMRATGFSVRCIKD